MPIEESAQTPSDRFLKWLKNFTEIMQEFAEIGADNVAWKALLRELHALGYAFTHMLLCDQASAVSKFEVGTSTKYHVDKDSTLEEPYRLIPTEIEVIEAEFPAPFLTEVFKLMWSHIVEAEIEPLALLELKRATLHSAPGPWVRVDRLSDRDNYTMIPRVHRHRRCAICHAPSRTPFHDCWYCPAHPCYHHGRCCPSRWPSRGRQGRRDLPVSGQPLL